MIEVIGKDLKDIQIINKSKADQIEFCINLDKEGLSPSVKEIIDVCSRNISKKIRVMLRKHSDNFFINRTQLKDLKNIIKKTKNLPNLDGYVFGAITKDKSIDFKALNEITKSIGNKNLTFHKAFDLVENKHEQLNILLQNKKIKYILTSGGPKSPIHNINFFEGVPNNLKKYILIGGGVNNLVIKKLKKLGYENFHTGTYVREKENYNYDINLKKIENLSSLLEEKNE